MYTGFPFLDGRLPLETTCAWKIPETDDEYKMGQLFANLTTGMTLDISVSDFEWLDTVCCTFLRIYFEYCSKNPIWIRNSDGCVWLAPPPGTTYNCPFSLITYVAEHNKKRD